MKEYISGREVIQKAEIRGSEVFLLENSGHGRYYMGPGPNGLYAVVCAGEGDFCLAYFRALAEGRFTEELSAASGYVHE